MPFDPSQPSELVSASVEPAFDPNQPSDLVQEGAPSAPATPADWHSLYGGLDGLDSRLNPVQRDAMATLDRATGNPKEYRARAVNQAFMQERFGGLWKDTYAEHGWEKTKQAYAKQELGIDQSPMTDTALYGAISGQLQIEDTGEIKPWTWKDRLLSNVGQFKKTQANTADRFWDSVNQPAVALPHAPADLPDVWMQTGSGMPLNPAIYGGVYNSVVKPILEGVESPFGIATLGVGSSLQAVSKTYPLARVALGSMSGVFAGLMGYETAKATPNAVKVLQDPNATTQEKVEAVGAPVGTGLMAVMGAMGTAMEMFPREEVAPVLKKLDGATPAEAAEVFRTEAKKVEATDTVHAEALHAAARELEQVAAHSPEIPKQTAKTAVSAEDAERFRSAKPSEMEKLIEEHTVEPAKVAEEVPPAEQEGSPISIKNATVDEQLKGMGEEPATHGEKLTFKDAKAGAAKALEEDPKAGERLMDELRANPRAVTGQEDALLLHTLNDLRNERSAAEGAVIEAAKSKDPVKIADARNRVEQARADFIEASDIVTKVGTSTAQGLALRRMMMNEDYSLAAMEQRRTAANDGKPLSAKEFDEVRKAHEKIAETGAAVDEYNARKAEMETDAEPSTKRQRPPSKSRPTAATKWLSEKADAARARILERMKSGRTLSGFDPVDFGDHIIVAADYIAKGIDKLPQLTAQMIQDFGKWIEPHMHDIFEHAVETLEAAPRQRKIEEQRTKLKNRIAELQEKIKTGDLSAAPVQANRPSIPELETLKVQRDELAGQLERMREEAAKVKELEASIAEKEKKLADGDLSPKGAKVSRPSVEAVEKLKQERDALNQQLQDARTKAKKEAHLERAAQLRLETLNKYIDAVKKKIETGDIAPKPQAVNRPEVQEIEVAKQKLEALRAELEQMREDAKPESGKANPEETARKAYKTRTKASIADLERRIAESDFSKPERGNRVLDPEEQKLKIAHERAKQTFETMVEKARLDAQPWWQKGATKVSDLARASALSGYHTLAKLAGYSAAKFAETPLTEGVGAVLKHTPGLKDITAKANLESGAEATGIAKFYVKAAREGMRDAWQTMKTGKSDLKAELGNAKQNHAPVHWYDYFGLSHMAEKSPLLRGEFEMRLEKATAHAIQNGVDVSDPLVQGALRKEAYEYSQRAILQENNKFSQWINQGHATLERIDPKMGEAQKSRVILSTLIKTFFTKGIVKTPANYIWQTLERSPGGLAYGVGKAALAKFRGIESLTPTEANTITRLLKVGAVGSAMFVWGLIDATKPEDQRMFGGYYQPGAKRKKEDVDFGKIRIMGHELPHFLTHSPPTEVAQMGSTMMRVARSKFRKRDKDEKGLVEGGMSALVSLASTAPVANPIMRMAESNKRGGARDWIGNLLAGLVPQLIANIAQDTDEKKRKATTPAEAIQAQIPVLREQLPERKGTGH